MEDKIKRAIAHSAVNRINGKSNNYVYDYDKGQHIPMTESYDYEAKEHISNSESGFYHYGVPGHVSLKTNGKSFSGYDYSSGAHFQGSVNGHTVQLYDYSQGRYFTYQV